MKKLTKRLIVKELLKLSTNYPNPKSNDDLSTLSEIWLEDFSHISEEIFMEAIKLHRRQSKFFPTVADILGCYSDIVRNKPKPIMIEEHQPEFTPERKAEMQRISTDYRAKRSKKKQETSDSCPEQDPYGAVKELANSITQRVPPISQMEG